MTPAPTLDDPRTRHFATFYGLEPLASGDPVALVVGNCQAESLRIVLDGPGLTTVRSPAIHELTRDDLPYLRRWLGQVDVLVCQPIRPGFGGLPVGTAELAAGSGDGARLVLVPVVRFAGLYPTHAIVRAGADSALTPPRVEYHDLRVVAEARDRRLGRPVRRARLDVAAVRAITAESLGQLRRRERGHDTLEVSDIFGRPSFDLMRTINHPGNAVWTTLAARVRDHLGLPAHPGDPGRPLLDAIHAPREAAVIEAFDLPDTPREDWRVDGRRVAAGEVREAHLRFYERHPAVVDAALLRHADALSALGLA